MDDEYDNGRCSFILSLGEWRDGGIIYIENQLDRLGG
jgi:hypothetical protein